MIPLRLAIGLCAFLVLLVLNPPEASARAPEMMNGPSGVGFEGDPTGGVIGAPEEISSGGGFWFPLPADQGPDFADPSVLSIEHVRIAPVAIVPIWFFHSSSMPTGMVEAGGVSRCR